MSSKPYILISNDDGIHAPGIKHLWNCLKDKADLIVVAPDREQSAVGLSITLRQPLKIDTHCWEGSNQIFSINGTPADCIKMALTVISKRKPDLIVSGINRGSNAGRNLLYSGTVAATIEGTMQNIPSIAFSCYDYHSYPNYADAEEYIPSIVDHVIQKPMPEGVLLNVTFPSKSHSVQGFKLAHQGLEYWGENPNEREHPAEGNSYYWLGATLRKYEEQEGSDIYWLDKGYVTAVPVQVHQLTDFIHLKERKNHFEELFSNFVRASS